MDISDEKTLPTSVSVHSSSDELDEATIPQTGPLTRRRSCMARRMEIATIQETGPLSRRRSRMEGRMENAGRPSWCRCRNCIEMTNLIERKCCRNIPNRPSRGCLANQPALLSRTRPQCPDFHHSPQQISLRNKLLRRRCYKWFTDQVYGRQGRGNRIPIPSCVVWRVRAAYPDPFGRYTGFEPIVSSPN